jgi:probable phosphoglycerate mutase
VVHPEPTRILAIRHGETSWNVESRVQGQLDIELNDTGRWQAERLAAALDDEPIAAIYASDLQRALDTARTLATRRGLSLQAERGRRERGFGEFEGLTFRDVESRWPEQAGRWRHRDPGFGPQGGETLADFYARCIGTVTRLASTHHGQLIALVAHGGVLDCMYRAAAGVELQAPRTWQLGNASINRLLFTGEGFTLVGWSDTSHLDVPTLDDEPL